MAGKSLIIFVFSSVIFGNLMSDINIIIWLKVGWKMPELSVHMDAMFPAQRCVWQSKASSGIVYIIPIIL